MAPEHTIAAYEAAVEAGVDALALDVRLSADDHLVVLHDADLDRTTDGRGPVRARSLRELKRLDAGRWFGRAFRGQRVQALSEVLERFRDRVVFQVALPAGSDFDPGIEERLVTLLLLHDLGDRVLVTSPDLPALVRCRELDVDLRLGVTVGARLLAPVALAPPGLLHTLCLDASLTTAADVARGRDAGLEVIVGPVDDPAAARPLVEAGVAGLVTDNPRLLAAALLP